MPKLNNTKVYDLAPEFWNVTLFSLISLAFILSDWIIFYSSFGDFILVFTGFLLLILGQFTLTKKQLMFGAIPILILILNYIMNEYYYEYFFDTTRALRSSLKIVLYVSVLLLVYSLIKRHHLSEQFLVVSNFFAITVVIIGIILTILIYFNRTDIYSMVWTYTRTDSVSYLFNNNPHIVRTRSLFSEPAHLGYYLNTLFFANIYSSRRNNYGVLTVLSFGIILTLSYSMIIIFIVTMFTYLSSKLIKKEFKWQHWYGLILVPIIFLVVLFWEYFDAAIIQRTKDILTGADGSAYNRIVESWIYYRNERTLFGNGIAHTPPVTNIFAYMLTDFGVVGLFPYLWVTARLFFVNVSVFLFFILMNSAKGGYLNPAFWVFLLYISLFYLTNKTDRKVKNTSYVYDRDKKFII